MLGVATYCLGGIVGPDRDLEKALLNAIMVRRFFMVAVAFQLGTRQ